MTSETLQTTVTANVVALTDNNELLTFSSDDLSSVTQIPVTGLEGSLLGIDVRPADGKIYGLTTANKIYTLDPAGATSGTFGRTVTLTESEEAALLSDNLYVNLHTQDFAGGELRGQIHVNLEHDIVERGLMLEESQQVNDVPDGPATSSFDAIYDDATNQLKISGSFSNLTSPLLPVGGVDPLGNPESAIHIHNGAAGANGPIIRNLTVDGDRFSGSFTLTDAEETELLNDNLYINLHTENFAGGELRGQIDVEVEGDVVASGLALEETQQVNEVPDGPATGMFDIVYDNSVNELATNGSFRNLTSPLMPVGGVDPLGNPESAIHIHNGAADANGPILRNLMTTDNIATFVSTLDTPFEGGTISGFDFNPVADRLRLVGDNDQDFRINVDTGAVIVDGSLAFAEGDRNAGINPNITAAAYTNSFEGTTSTQLYNIDTLLNTLVLQNPPNDGILTTVGELGLDFDTLGGFDILSDPDAGNVAFAVSNNTFYSIDLDSGNATEIGMLGSDPLINIQGLTLMASDMGGDMDDVMDSGSGMDIVWLSGGPATVVLNKEEGCVTVNNLQMGYTEFKFSDGGDLSFGDSAHGATIFKGDDLLAVVTC